MKVANLKTASWLGMVAAAVGSGSGQSSFECSSVGYSRRRHGLIGGGLVGIEDSSINQTRRGRSGSRQPGHGCGSVEQTGQRRAGLVSGVLARRDGAIW